MVVGVFYDKTSAEITVPISLKIHLYISKTTIKNRADPCKPTYMEDARLIDLGDEGEGGLLDGPLLILAGLDPP